MKTSSGNGGTVPGVPGVRGARRRWKPSTEHEGVVDEPPEGQEVAEGAVGDESIGEGDGDGREDVGDGTREGFGGLWTDSKGTAVASQRRSSRSSTRGSALVSWGGAGDGKPPMSADERDDGREWSSIAGVGEGRSHEGGPAGDGHVRGGASWIGFDETTTETPSMASTPLSSAPSRDAWWMARVSRKLKR